MRARRRSFLNVLLAALALPGLVLLVVDLLRPSPRVIAEKVCRYRRIVDRWAERFELSSELVLAVIAVESKGDSEARSIRGALGLMQLMPPTAREVARWLEIPEPTDEDLLDPETNILLGCAYLREQMDTFGECEPLVLAAYQAGPGRVRRWLSEWPDLDPGEALDKAAFPVTRSYVRNVLQYRKLLIRELERKKHG